MPRRRERRAGLEFVDALPADGERRLLLALLLDAIQCVSHPAPEDHELSYPAWLRDIAWILEDDRRSLCSFVNVCEVLGLNPNYIRRRVMAQAGRTARTRIRRYAGRAENSWDRQRAQFAARAMAVAS